MVIWDFTFRISLCIKHPSWRNIYHNKTFSFFYDSSKQIHKTVRGSRNANYSTVLLTTAANTKLVNVLQNQAKEFWKWIYCCHRQGRKCVKPKILVVSQGENIPIIRQHINQQIFTKRAGHLIKTIHSKPNIILTPSQKIQAINIGKEWCFLHSATMGQRHCLPHTCLLCDTTTLFHTQAISQSSLSSFPLCGTQL